MSQFCIFIFFSPLHLYIYIALHSLPLLRNELYVIASIVRMHVGSKLHFVGEYFFELLLTYKLQFVMKCLPFDCISKMDV